MLFQQIRRQIGRSSTAEFFFTIEVSRLENLGRIMDKTNQVSNVINVKRNRNVKGSS